MTQEKSAQCQVFVSLTVYFGGLSISCAVVNPASSVHSIGVTGCIIKMYPKGSWFETASAGVPFALSLFRLFIGAACV